MVDTFPATSLLQVKLVLFVAVFACVTFKSVVSQSWSPTGWYAFGNSLYLAEDTPKIYSSARSTCQGYGGDLALLNTEEINSFLTDFTTRSSSRVFRYWFGLNDLALESKFRWTDGTTLSRRFSPWEEGEPNNFGGNEDCVDLRSNSPFAEHGTWNDNWCRDFQPFICERHTDDSQSFSSKRWHTFGNTSYRVIGTSERYANARAECQFYGGDLAMLKTHQINSFVASLLSRPSSGHNHYWIGLHDMANESTFEWIDGTSLDAGFSPWNAGEPNDYSNNEDCAQVISAPRYTSGTWNDNLCQNSLGYICEKQLSHPELNQLNCLEVGINYVVISWTNWNESAVEGVGPVVGYNVYTITTDGIWMNAGYKLANGTSGTDFLEQRVTGLKPGTRYSLVVSTVREQTTAGGIRGAGLTVTTRAVQLPVLKQPPRLVDVGTDYIVISWTKWNESADTGDGPVIGYNVYTKTKYSNWTNAGYQAVHSPHGRTGTVLLTYRLPGLQPDTQYKLCVSTIRVGTKTGIRGPELTVKTTELHLPVLIHPPYMVDVGLNYIVISWTRWNESVDTGDGPVTGYNVYTKTENSNWTNAGYLAEPISPGTSRARVLMYRATGLQPNTHYNVSIVSIRKDTEAEGIRGPELTARTRAIILPVLCQPPRAEDVGIDYIVISWTKWNESVDAGDGPVIGYNVYIKTGNSNWTNTGHNAASTANGTSIIEVLVHRISGLMPDTQYYVSISTIREAKYVEGTRGPELTTKTRMIPSTSRPKTPAYQSLNSYNASGTQGCMNCSCHDTTLPWVLFVIALTGCVILGFLAAVPRWRRNRLKLDTSLPTIIRETTNQTPQHSNIHTYHGLHKDAAKDERPVEMNVGDKETAM